MQRHGHEADEESDQRGFLHFDFQTLYPYKFWISSWGRDRSYPNGFRYKLLTGLDRGAGTSRLVILLEEPGELKTSMADICCSQDEIDHVAESMAEHLTTQFNIAFTEYDFSSADTFDEYCRLSKENGWLGPERVYPQ